MPNSIIVIDKAHDTLGWLSNFSPIAIEYEGLTYPSVECAYQAAKFLDPKEREKFVWMQSWQAKRAGREKPARVDWASVKYLIMFELLLKKYTYPRMQERLLGTGNAIITHENTHGDQEWGKVNGVGLDILAKMTMYIRDEVLVKKIKPVDVQLKSIPRFADWKPNNY
jgi:predicted NAD-dependent protein-ADP-ribosyltransferase YbiA (DUF1768 family)